MTDALPTPLDVKLMNTMALALFTGFMLLLVGTVAVWAAGHPWFAVRGITVTGQVAHTNAALLRANVSPRLSGTFFTLDITAARDAFESIGWVRQARVSREFPNRLKVTLEEHQAVAYWGGEGEPRLINSFGEVYEANVGEVEQDHLPQLNGPEGQGAEVLAIYRAIAPLFDDMEMPVEQLELTRGGSWRARLESGATIELGRGTEGEVAARVRRFLTTLVQVTSRYERRVSALESADLRHENGYALRLRGVTTLVAEGVKK